MLRRWRRARALPLLRLLRHERLRRPPLRRRSAAPGARPDARPEGCPDARPDAPAAQVPGWRVVFLHLHHAERGEEQVQPDQVRVAIQEILPRTSTAPPLLP